MGTKRARNGVEDGNVHYALRKKKTPMYESIQGSNKQTKAHRRYIDVP